MNDRDVKGRRRSGVLLSVVVPMYNEHDSVEPFFERHGVFEDCIAEPE